MKQHAKGTLDEISDTGSFDSTHTEGSPEGTDNSPRTRQKKLCSGSKIKHDAELQRRMNDVAEQLGIERIIFCQSIIRRFLEMGRFRRKVEMHRKRNKLVKKLVATEQEYVEHLSVVVGVYLQPLREGGSGNDFLPYPRALRSLSSDLDVLRNYNTHLLRTLEMRFQSWSPFQSIGDIFLTMNHFLKPYSNYCTHYKKALSTLGKLSRNSSFIKFIKKTAKRPECDSKLASHLLHLPYVLHLPYLLDIPVQRIPQYKSYLDAIVKNTWSDHPDLVSLQQAAHTITDLSNFVSDTQADVQHIIKVLTVQISLRGDIDNLVTKTRRLVREGDLVEVCTDGERETRHLFLFNDLLLWVKVLPPIFHSKPPSPRRPPHIYQVEGMQPLLQITSVHELSSRPGFDAIALSKGGGLLEHEPDPDADVRVRSDPDESGYDGKGYGFSITTPTGVMVFLVSTRPLRKAWLADLYSCIDDAVARHYYRLVEKRKEAMHRELLSVTEGRVLLAEGRGRTPSISQSNPSKHKLSRKKKRPLTISRIMGRRIELGETLPETQTTHNPLLSRGQSGTSGRTLSIGGELGQGQASGVPRGRGSIALDSSPLNIPAMSGNQKLLQKSVSATQLDILMAEMREDPRRAMFVAPRLDHSLKHIGQPRNKERDREKEKERDKEKGNKARRTPKNHKLASGSAEEFELKPNMASKFTRSISWTLIPRLTVTETPKKANNHIQQERPASKGGRFSLRAATVDHGFVGDSNEGETKGKDLPPLPPKLGRTGESNMILSAGDKSKGKLRPAVGGARTKERKAGKEKDRDEAKIKGT